jgi:hypothetical protein
VFGKCPRACRSHSSLRHVYWARKFHGVGFISPSSQHDMPSFDVSYNIRIRYTRMGGLCSSSLILTAEDLHLPVGVYFSHLQTCILIALRGGSAVSGNLRGHVGLPVLLWLYISFWGGRTPWTGDQPVARPLPTRKINAHRHPCLEWDSNPRLQCLSGQRQFTL